MSTAVITQWDQGRADGYFHVAENTAIQSETDYQLAADDLQIVLGLKAEADSYFNPIVQDTHRAHAQACAQRKRALDPLLQAEALLKRKIGAWVEAQEQAQKAEEARLRAEAERQVLEQREQDILAAEQLGAAVEEIEAIANEPIERRPVITPYVHKAAGISARDIWYAKVTNLQALIVFVAAHPEYNGLLVPNVSAITGIARSLRAACNLPGVEVWRQKSIAGSRR